MGEGAALLHAIFAETARQHPQRTAIEVPPDASATPRRIVTYADLQRQASAWASAAAPHAAADAMIAVLLARHDPALYAAQLGILAAGAAFTCLDPSFPDGHLGEVLADAAAVATDAHGRERLARLGIHSPPVIAAGLEAAALPAVAITDHNLAYVIYTSGTTGRPKGVMVEHRAIVNLVRADQNYFHLPPEARVAQCSSPAYDSSLEETWLALSAGATLVLLDDATIRLGPDLVPWLRRECISVFCPPPTLLRATGCRDPEAELPGLKLLYVGGEALPQDLADLWARGRWMENGYGPTECTVTSVRARVRPGESVAIGIPVAGCEAHVLHASGDEAAPGEPGELCLGGACLARGYRQQEALTKEKFPIHPRLGRLYRTGDRVRRRDDGQLEYLGRLDAQVKLRGYRIELEAVEAALAACTGVRAAACRLQGAAPNELLAAHVIAADPAAPPAVEALRQTLRRSLPEYMVPGRIGWLDALPTSAGGKLDRAQLPELDAPGTARTAVAARNLRERAVAEAFAAALRRAGAVSVEDDFFLDLGGDSLSAVDCIVHLRALGWNTTVRDLYEARTAAAVAARGREPAAAAPAVAPAAAMPAAGPRPGARPALCTAAQAAWIVAELVAASALGYAAAFLLLPRLAARFTLWKSLLGLLLAAQLGFLLYIPVSVAAVALLKKVLIGRYRALRAPVWSGFYLRHWIVVHAARAIPWGVLQGTEAQAWALRSLGARVGRRVAIARDVDLARGGWDLLRLGDHATLGRDVALRLADLDDGHVRVGPVTVGAGATLDIRAGMEPGSELAANAYLEPLECLPAGAVGRAPAPAAPPLTQAGELSAIAHSAIVVAWRSAGVLLAGIPWLLLAVLAPAADSARFTAWLATPRWHFADVALAAVAAAAAVVAALAVRAILARLFGAGFGRGRVTTVSAWSLAAMRLDASIAQVEGAGRWLSGTLLWPVWLRAAGMRLGRGCEISTILEAVPQCIAIGAESFFADGIYLGPPRRHRGRITVAPTTLGAGTFLGNHAVIVSGHRWPEGLFAGIATVPDPRAARSHSAWFGQPPLELPRKPEVVDRRFTHNPGALRYAARMFWELSRLALPLLPLLLAAAWSAALYAAGARWGDWALALAAAPLATAGCAAAAALAIIVLKWLLLGRVRPGQRYFWSCWCGRWDFLYMAWQYWGPMVLLPFDGTLLLNQFLRLTGVRLGRRVALGPGFAQVVDPDLLQFDDDTTVSSHMQAHTFEDRILKMDRIHACAGATLGDDAIVLYGTTIGAGAELAPHSVLMKHDQIPPASRFAGAPARPAEAPAGAAAIA